MILLNYELLMYGASHEIRLCFLQAETHPDL